VRWFEESLPKLEVTLTETRAALVMEHREKSGEWRRGVIALSLRNL
jgi:hypothetical protein